MGLSWWFQGADVNVDARLPLCSWDLGQSGGGDWAAMIWEASSTAHRPELPTTFEFVKKLDTGTDRIIPLAAVQIPNATGGDELSAKVP